MAETQRKLADEQFAFARQAVDDMYTEASEKWLSQQVNPAPIQQEFLNKALGFYQKFATSPGRDAEARHRALHASARVGEIQQKLSRLAGAEQAYRQQLSLAQGLVKEAPDKPEYRRDEAEAHLDYGEILLRLGRTREAERVLREGVKLQEALTAELPTVNHQLTMAMLLTGLGHLLEHTGRRGEAESLYRRGLGILEKLESKEADDPLFRKTLVTSLGALGRLLRDTGRAGEADAVYRRCVALLEPVLRAQPKNPDLRSESVRLVANWGSCPLAGRAIRGGRDATRRAVEQSKPWSRIIRPCRATASALPCCSPTWPICSTIAVCHERPTGPSTGPDRS